MEFFKKLLLSLILFSSSSSFAQSYFGITVSDPLYSTEPLKVHGIQVMLKYEPCRLRWPRFSVYFDGGYSFFHTSDYGCHTAVSIFSAAPVLRYTCDRYCFFRPYWELSIGLSYLNHTRLAHRNLGMHFAFQDRVGIGTWLGYQEKLSLGLHAVHYSNGHLCNHNSGFTVPFVLDLSYRF